MHCTSYNVAAVEIATVLVLRCMRDACQKEESCLQLRASRIQSRRVDLAALRNTRRDVQTLISYHFLEFLRVVLCNFSGILNSVTWFRVHKCSEMK